MKNWSYILLGILLHSLYASFSALGKSNSDEIGEKLFMTNCSPCHGIGKEKLGPSLASITKKRPQEWLVNFIQNSQNVILSGDVYANHLYEQYHQTVMPSFNKLSVNEIVAVLEYINKESVKPRQYNSYYPELDDAAKSHRYISLGGSILFAQHCSNCHSLEREKYGPALASVSKRHSREWLIGFIRNSESVIKSGDPYAVNLYNNFDKKRMPMFNFLDTASINSILKYIEYESASPSFIAGVNGRKSETAFIIHSNKLLDVKPIKNNDENKIFSIVFIGIVLSGSLFLFALLLRKFYFYLKSEESE